MSFRKRHRFSSLKSLALRRLPTLGAMSVIVATTLTPAEARASSPTPTVEAHTERERRASARYQLGASAYREEKYREAVNHFLAADELVPSAALSYNIALAYDKLEEAARALSFYRDYLRRSPRGENAGEVGARIRELELMLMKQGVQQLTVRSDPPGALVRIEDEPVGMTPWTGELRPGEHRLTVSLKGYQQGFRQVLLPAANATDVFVDLAPVPDELVVASSVAGAAAASSVPPSPALRSVAGPRSEASSGSTFVPWLTVGVGAAALAAAGTFELLRQQSESQARSAITQDDYAKRRDQAGTYQTTSLILLGTGGGLVLTGGVLLLIGASDDAEPAPARVACTAAGCFGAYAGSF